MPALDIVDRLKLLSRGDHLDLVDIVCADAIEEIMRLREAVSARRSLDLPSHHQGGRS